MWWKSFCCRHIRNCRLQKPATDSGEKALWFKNSFYSLLALSELSDVAFFGQQTHLVDRSLVQQLEAFAGRKRLLNQMSVQRFEIGEANELCDVGVIVNVTTQSWIFFSPLLRGLPEESHVQQVSLTGIHEAYLVLCQGRWNQVLSDSVGTDIQLANLRAISLWA